MNINSEKFPRPKIFTNGSPITPSQEDKFHELLSIHIELRKGYRVLRILFLQLVKFVKILGLENF